ncbi:Cytochrome P450 hydroxylase, partial [Streptomyces clavuligerus]
FTDPDLLSARVPHPEFALARRTAPVCWVPQRPGTTGFDDGGYWAVTRHADVKYVSTRPDLFSSYLNTAVIRFHESIQRDQIDVRPHRVYRSSGLRGSGGSAVRRRRPAPGGTGQCRSQAVSTSPGSARRTRRRTGCRSGPSYSPHPT